MSSLFYDMDCFHWLGVQGHLFDLVLRDYNIISQNSTFKLTSLSYSLKIKPKCSNLAYDNARGMKLEKLLPWMRKNQHVLIDIYVHLYIIIKIFYLHVKFWLSKLLRYFIHLWGSQIYIEITFWINLTWAKENPMTNYSQTLKEIDKSWIIYGIVV